MTTLPDDFGDAVAWLRLQAGLSQTELAVRIGVGRVFVAKLEANTRGMRPERRDALLDAIGVTPDLFAAVLEEKPWRGVPEWNEPGRQRTLGMVAYARSHVSRAGATWSDPVEDADPDLGAQRRELLGLFEQITPACRTRLLDLARSLAHPRR